MTPREVFADHQTDKLLEKDVAKSKISSEDAQAIKNRVTTVTNVSELAGKDVQLAMEVFLHPLLILAGSKIAEQQEQY